jgi:hypothetical protein
MMAAQIRAVLMVVLSRETRAVKTSQDTIRAAIRVMMSRVMVGELKRVFG